VATKACTDVPDPCAGQTCPNPCDAPNQNPGGTLNTTTCQWEGVDCTCMPKPPLEPAFAGQHSSLAMRPDGVPVISGYYGDPYGDLIYGVASSASAGATVEWEYVDGVPQDAPCEGDPDGPRGGIAEPGEDVGWDTSLVVDASGMPRISYYDRTNQALKYAVYNGASWDIHVIDAKGTTGRYTSMVLDSSGVPHIAYMTTRDNLTSYLKVAKANSANPMFTEDWTISVADAAPIPCLPDDCPDGQACIESTGQCSTTQDESNCQGAEGCPDGSTCVAAECIIPQDNSMCNGGAGCDVDCEVCVNGECVTFDDPSACHEMPGCDSKHVCVLGVCMAEMQDPVAEFLPDGVGLFASLALYSDGSPAVAYYDNNHGNLMFVYWTGAGFGPPELLAGEDTEGNDLGNLGTDPSLAISGDTVHLAYQDADLGDLYYITFSGQNTGAATVELVDLGARDASGNATNPEFAVGGLHWVGNFSSLIVDASGEVRIAYQDGTTSDLVYATKFGGGWSIEILARKLAGDAFDGAYGFFADQVMDNGGGFAVVSNFKHNLRTDPPSSDIDIRTK
jgi:hypothetical protein